MNNPDLSEQAREVRRQYARRWRAQNPEKVKEINRRYWERKALTATKEEASICPKN